jgi:hypothetical protein
MPFTLDQLDFLGVHLGVVIPPEFIENKRRAEEFKTRSAEITARSDEMKQRRDAAALEALFTQAAAAGAGNDFAAALKLLDQLEAGLAVPDAPPPPPTPTPPGPEAKSSVPKVKAATGAQVLFAQAQLAWETTCKKVQAELRRMEEAILAAAAEEPDLAAIATKVKDIYGILGGLDTNLRDKLDEGYVAQTPEEKAQRHDEARALIQKTTDFVNGDPLMAVIDNNPFGTYDVKGCVTAALKELAGRFA